MKKQLTMRVNTKTQQALAFKLANAMEDQSKWLMDGENYLVKSFRPTETTNQIMVYLEEF